MSVHRFACCVTVIALTLSACLVDARKPSADAAFTGSRSLRYEIVRMHTHDASRFTQGLEFGDGALLESVGLYGRSALTATRIGSSRPLRERRLQDDVFAEGLTMLGQRIYQLSWREGLLFIYDRDFKLLGTRCYEGEGWGLANDGEQLIMSDGSARLSFRSADDFRVLRSIEVHDGGRRVAMLNELEYAAGLLFANVWLSDRIAVIDPADGRVLAWLELDALREQLPALTRHNSDAVLNGIAHDASTGHFYVTGKLWPRLFELRIDELPRPPSGRAR